MGKKKQAALLAAAQATQKEVQIDYSRLAANLLKGVGQNLITTKDVGSTPTATYGHGPLGLFSAPGLSAPLFSAMILPNQGLQSVLPVRPSRDANPLYGIITGVTATNGSEPVGVCDDPPTAGTSKLCEHSFVFGRQSRQSPVVQLDRVGLWTNRGEFGDLSLMNNPFRSDVQVPTIPGADVNNMARNEVAKTLFEFGVAWSRDFAKELYTGNPTNNTAGGGRKYFYGLDTLINTGYRDAETGVACPAADSLVRSFGSLDISARDANGNFTNGTTLVRTVTNIYRNLRFLAQKAGLEPVEWVLSMPWSMFYEITEVWPIAYQTYRNTVSTGGTNYTINDAVALTAQRDAMRGDIYNRTGQYLLIDGVRVPCILDDSITETVLAGESFTATMYFVPLTVLGGTPVTLIEYLPFDQPGGALEAARLWAPGNSYYVTDNGRFFWHLKPPTNFCVQFVSLAQPRVLLLTPYLAARLTAIKYTPLAHERSGFTDSSYWVDGGKTGGSGISPSYFSPTS